MAEYAGTGIHHIAFDAPDIFAVAEALVATGVATMPVPETYYPDLAARFALPAETLKRMQDHGILYDEGTHGRFSQMHTKPFCQRFAFEIVQRQGYRGFGAPNAPLRIAMQRRDFA